MTNGLSSFFVLSPNDCPMLFATALVALATVSGVFSAPVLSSKALARSHEVVQRSFEARGLLDSLRRPLPNTDPVQPPPADENSGNLADVLHRPLPPSTDPVQPPPADENSGISADILRRPLPPSTDLEERGIGKDDVCYPPFL